MLRLVEASRRIQWDTFRIQDDYVTQFKINAGIAIISEKMLGAMLDNKRWSGVRYKEDGIYKIGYGVGDPLDEQGQTEAESYAEWIGYVRNQQKIVRAQLPIVGITQAAFDALTSLYVDTGSWRTVEAKEGTYDLADAISNGNWLLAADILSRGKYNPKLRMREARIMMLGDYGTNRDRNQHMIYGIQQIRKAYVNGIKNEFDKKQAEFVYYRQLGIFLPGMSQLRQRRIVAQSNSV